MRRGKNVETCLDSVPLLLNGWLYIIAAYIAVIYGIVRLAWYCGEAEFSWPVSMGMWTLGCIFDACLYACFYKCARCDVELRLRDYWWHNGEALFCFWAFLAHFRLIWLVMSRGVINDSLTVVETFQRVVICHIILTPCVMLACAPSEVEFETLEYYAAHLRCAAADYLLCAVLNVAKAVCYCSLLWNCELYLLCALYGILKVLQFAASYVRFCQFRTEDSVCAGERVYFLDTEENRICGICYENMDDNNNDVRFPIRLHGMHVYCNVCVKTLVSAGHGPINALKFPCPACRCECVGNEVLDYDISRAYYPVWFLL